MRLLLVVLVVLGLAGCATLPTHDQIRNNNRMGLLRLSVGMSKAEALEAMGGVGRVNLSDGLAGASISNPYRTETWRAQEGKPCEVLFYYTDIKKADGAITDDELTPILIRDGRVAGWGWRFVGEEKQHYQIDIR